MYPLSFHSLFRFFGPERPTKKQVENVFLAELLSCADYLDFKRRIPLLEQRLKEFWKVSRERDRDNPPENVFKIVPLEDYILIVSSGPEVLGGAQLYGIFSRPKFLV